MISPKSFASLFVVTAVAALTTVSPDSAASVRKDGSWPAAEKRVSFQFEGKPEDGLDKLANEAGWSFVMSKGVALGAEDVKINVTDQPADAVLEALFLQANVVAHRNGTLVSVTPDANAAATPATAAPLAVPALPAPPAPATPPGVTDAKNRDVLGGSAVIAKGEIVRTLTVAGGSVRIEGTVTGDLVVMGGTARLEPGAHVLGNATAFGGTLRVASGARIDGQVGVLGGVLKRDDGAIIGGKVVGPGYEKGNVSLTRDESGFATTAKADAPEPERSRLSRAAESFGKSVTRISLLFVFGCVLLALATRRMDALRLEAAAKPMRSFALGVVGTFVGGIVLAVALTALAITIVGIPFAVAGVLALVFALYAAIAAVLTTFGAAVIGHKTKNAYVHLAFGCAVFLLVSSIPVVGGIVTFLVGMVAVGVLVSTRLAGSLSKAKPPRAALV